MSSSTTSLIHNFYRSFSELDPEGMAACYHPDIEFEDPAFGKLKGDMAINMWRMLCDSQKGKDFRITYSILDESEDGGTARWEAFYTYGKNKRRVHNIITGEFRFRDGRIIQHTDRFDLYRWSRQALGITGALIGWTPWFRKKLHGQTNQLLKKFMGREQAG